jgi:hypothetical protein
MNENIIPGALQEEFIAEGFRLYLKGNRRVPSNDTFEHIYYVLHYTQQLDELEKSLFLANSILPENIINQYKNNKNIQYGLKKAKAALKTVINDDKKIMRERWQSALKKAWEQLPHEKREHWRQKLTDSAQFSSYKTVNKVKNT